MSNKCGGGWGYLILPIKALLVNLRGIRLDGRKKMNLMETSTTTACLCWFSSEFYKCQRCCTIETSEFYKVAFQVGQQKRERERNTHKNWPSPLLIYWCDFMWHWKYDHVNKGPYLNHIVNVHFQWYVIDGNIVKAIGLFIILSLGEPSCKCRWKCHFRLMRTKPCSINW